MTRPQDKLPKAPESNADKSVHKKHAEDFLKVVDFENPAKVNLPGYVDKIDTVPED